MQRQNIPMSATVLSFLARFPYRSLLAFTKGCLKVPDTFFAQNPDRFSCNQAVRLITGDLVEVSISIHN